MIAKSHAILDSICVVLFWVSQFWGFWKYRRLKLAPKKEARWLWFGLQVSILRLALWVLLFVVTKWTSGSRLGFIHNEDSTSNWLGVKHSHILIVIHDGNLYEAVVPPQGALSEGFDPLNFKDVFWKDSNQVVQQKIKGEIQHCKIVCSM